MFLRSTSLSCGSQSLFVLLWIWTSFLAGAVSASPLPLGDGMNKIEIRNAPDQFPSHESIHSTRMGIYTPREPTKYTVDVGYSIRFEGDRLEYWSLYFGKDILEAIPGKDSRTWDPRTQALVPNHRHSDLEQMGDLGSSYQHHWLGKANFENESEALGIFQKLGSKEGNELIKMPPASTIGGLSLDYGRLVLEHLKKEGHIEDDVMKRYMESYKVGYRRVSENRFGVVWDPPA
ncbi:uncharacterized protein C8R40DRAFT_462686 [Lentinula edodes]|uniref:uncharacterized protein n=1 Tax=Lentinula edodes TaxID=5353 RepID=UPI001E8DA99C|nr:uncharacterized protein C8R40DRAFT_462686 [Lentinula edodes]KAH7880050.1 hypothetical protein C8R40DRAFT_462686 [Lentinula edodes]